MPFLKFLHFIYSCAINIVKCNVYLHNALALFNIVADRELYLRVRLIE